MMRFSVALLYLVASLGMALLTSALHFDRDPRSCLAAMLDGSAHRPFILRRLVPDVIGTLTRWTPQAWQERTVQLVKQLPPPLPRLLLGREPRVAFAHLMLVLSVWGCYWGVLCLWKALFEGLLVRRDVGARHAVPVLCFVGFAVPVWALPLLGLGGVYPLLNWRHGVHLYDPATLLLYSAALWALLNEKSRLYGLLFALALWHKETALLLIAWWVVGNGVTGTGRTGRRVWLDAALMLSLYLAVRLWLAWRYQGNPGSAFEFWWQEENLPLLTSMVTEFGGRPFRFLLILLIAVALPAWGWRQKPLSLRQRMLIGLVVMGIPWLLFGILDEFRALLELYPLWLMLCLPGGYSLPFSKATAPSGTVNRS